jgi:hypothetical protein
MALQIIEGGFVILPTVGFILAPNAPNKSLAVLMPDAE